MEAIYISANSFSVIEDKTDELLENRRLKFDCGIDGLMYASVVSSGFSTVTTVVIDEDILTTNLEDVLYGVVKPGTQGNLPSHFHTDAEGDGGYISTSSTFLELTDTFTTYSGGNYLRTTISGIESIDGVIITAPNSSEWVIQITNSGTLYTMEL